MASQEYVDLLRRGVAGWNRWREQQPDAVVDLEAADLSGLSLDGADLGAANLADSDLRNTQLVGANLVKAVLIGADLTDSDLSYSDLTDADLRGATLARCDLSRTNLKRAQMFSADLTNSTVHRAQLDRTELKGVRIGADHLVMEDGSETIRLGRRDRALNWKVLRFIGSLPLFGVSWAGLALSLMVINGIGLLNERMILASLSYPIPIPHRMTLILVDTILLVVGSTLFRLACPPRIQEFSETAWVEQHRNPRLLYLAECFSGRGLQWPTVFLNAGGALLGIFLLVERIWLAGGYIIGDWNAR